MTILQDMNLPIKNVNDKGLYFITKLKMPVRETNKIIGNEMKSLFKSYDLDNKIKLAQIYDKTTYIEDLKFHTVKLKN